MLSRYFDERSNDLVFDKSVCTDSVPSVASQVGRRNVQGCSPGGYNLKVDAFSFIFFW